MLAWMQELAPYGIFTTDCNFRIKSWNEWLETHSGLAASLVIGRGVFEVFPDLRTRKLDEHFRRAALGEVIVLSTAFHGFLLPFVPTVRDAGCEHMQQTARIAPLLVSGSVCGTITIIEDVTQREVQSMILARKQERDQLLSSALAHLLRTRDPETMVKELFPKLADCVRVDACFHHMVEPASGAVRLHGATGVSDEQRRGLESPRPQDSLGGLVAAQRSSVLVSDLQTTTEARLARERSMGFLALVGYPLLVGTRLIGTLTFGTRTHSSFSSEDLELLASVVQYVAIALDRALTETALQRAERELRHHAEDLEAKVLERTARLQDTVVQLESFSYTVAHDLRAPIRALKGYAQVLLEQAEAEPELFPPNGRHYLARIERAAGRLEAITRDLLQFSTISRQDVTLSVVDLEELVRDLQLLRPTLNDTVLSVQQPLHRVIGHRTLLQHCLSNLLDNAVKFIAPGNAPRIVVRSEVIQARLLPPRHLAYNLRLGGAPDTSTITAAAPEQPGEKLVRIWVEDNGIGIPPESQEKIFGIFERLHSPEQYEGTGIGLAIVARAMDRLGGSCGVESFPGNGSRFWLLLRSA